MGSFIERFLRPNIGVCVQSKVGFMQGFAFKKITHTFLDHKSRAHFMKNVRFVLEYCLDFVYTVNKTQDPRTYRQVIGKFLSITYK